MSPGSGDDRSLRGILGEVAQLVRIVVVIVELNAVDAAVVTSLGAAAVLGAD